MRWRASLVVVTALAGCAVHDTAVGADTVVIVFQQPPAPKAEPVEARTGFLRIPGHWAWRDGHWQWTPGSWERGRAGYAWKEGRWERRGQHWEWVEGQWIAASTAPMPVPEPVPDSGSGSGSGSTAP